MTNIWDVIKSAVPRRLLKGEGISLLVPFRSDGGRRQETWEWLRHYWALELPGAELIQTSDDHTPFCKTAAVNAAARRATGDVFVILDADCYIPGDVILYCANEIRKARDAGRKLWYMPYRYFWRLTDGASRMIIDSDPMCPPRFFAANPSKAQVEGTDGSGSPAKGHWYGALIQLMPREAFFAPGGMDERFRGWGGEDVAFMHAVDTLYAQHRTSDNGVIHLWHPSIGTSVKNRMWVGQENPNANGNLAARYGAATGDYGRMLALVNENL